VTLRPGSRFQLRVVLCQTAGWWVDLAQELLSTDGWLATLGTFPANCCWISTIFTGSHEGFFTAWFSSENRLKWGLTHSVIPIAVARQDASEAHV
jgi:hypothetical protein